MSTWALQWWPVDAVEDLPGRGAQDTTRRWDAEPLESATVAMSYAALDASGHNEGR